MPRAKSASPYLSATLAAVGLLVATPAFAQTPPPRNAAAAERLFDEGRTLMEAQRYPEACAKFAASQRADPGVGTLLNLAECYERRGQLASAWATYREAESYAKRENQTGRVEFAVEREQALMPLLAQLTVTVAASAKVRDLSIECDGVVLAEAAWGTPIPVDPGRHLVRVRAPRYETWTVTVDLDARGTRVVTVPVLQPRPEPGPPDRPASGPSARAILGYGLGGLGLVAVGVGTMFGLRTFSEYGNADRNHCTAKDCDARGIMLVDDSKRDALLSTLLIAGGAAVVASGIFLLVTGRGASAQPAGRVGSAPPPLDGRGWGARGLGICF